MPLGEQPASSRSSLARAGEVVSGKFRVERVLGQGGMGVVVAATHLQLDEPVALKFLHAHAIADPEALARFTREAKAAAKLKSEHVARVLDVGMSDDGTPYIVMEYLEGNDLAHTIQSHGPLDVPSATEYIIQACEGLAEAHSRGIVHRDIKPENLFLVDRGQGWRLVKILDFGISKFAMTLGTPEASNLSTRNIMGSPCYMSPEQLRSTANVDLRTDIWSVGVTLFELLTGRTAYDSSSTFPALVAAILEQPVPRLADVLPSAPPELSAVVARCMAKDRNDRFASAAEVALALLPFAPKRARTSAERAVAVTKAAGMSTPPLVAGVLESPSHPPPAPPLLPTLRVNSGSDLLTPRVPSVASPAEPSVATAAETGNTLVTPSLPEPTKRTPRALPWVTLVGVAIAAAAVISWAMGHRRPPTVAAVVEGRAAAPPDTGPAATATPAAAPSPPAPAPVAPATSDEEQRPSPPAVSASSTPPAMSATRHPVAPSRPQHPAPSLPNPQASPDPVDIRMQR